MIIIAANLLICQYGSHYKEKRCVLAVRMRLTRSTENIYRSDPRQPGLLRVWRYRPPQVGGMAFRALPQVQQQVTRHLLELQVWCLQYLLLVKIQIAV